MTHVPAQTLDKTQFLFSYRFENDGAHQQKIKGGKDEKPM